MCYFHRKLINHTYIRICRLHIETDCGRHRSWNCSRCGPNLLTADAYKVHMETQHASVMEAEDAFIITKIEDTSNETETINPIKNVAEADVSSFSSLDDPLLFKLKEENCFDEDIGNSMSIESEEDSDDVSEFTAEENSNEK